MERRWGERGAGRGEKNDIRGGEGSAKGEEKGGNIKDDVKRWKM